MTSSSAYYLFAALFIAATAATAFAAAQSKSPLRFLSLAGIALSVVLSYWSLDYFLGRPKPVPGPTGWHGPTIGPDGAVVLGGRIDQASGSAYLMLDGTPPMAFHFDLPPPSLRGLKQAMQEHAKTHGGEKWGFSIKEDGSAGKPYHADKAGTGTPGQAGAKSLEDRKPEFKFEEPVAPDPPPKDAPAEYQTVPPA